MPLCSWRATKQTNTRKEQNTMNKNMQYTEEWFDEARHYSFDWKDLKAIKERLEHLPKMMDELNEKLKNGDKDAHYLATRMKHHAQRTMSAIESNEGYISWGRADMMITY